MAWISRAFLFTFVAAVVWGASEPARAQGNDLTGRLAPDLSFSDGMNGVAAGSTLSSFRGKVVWVKFILRDCPRCRASMPRAQQLHDRWGGSGLVVLTVVRRFGPAGMRSFMAQNQYDFRVGTDPDGSLASRYGVRTMPTDYVIGGDGRVKASNGAPESVLLTELGKYRLARLGTVPESMLSVRDAVWNWDYGTALRTVEAAVAGGGGDAEDKALAARVSTQAREELDARLALASKRARQGKTDIASSIYDRVVEKFEGTSLAPLAQAARDRFRAGLRGR